MTAPARSWTVDRLVTAALLLVATLCAADAQAEDMVYAITDVRITDSRAASRARSANDIRNVKGHTGEKIKGYTGVSSKQVTLPYIPGKAGGWVKATDVNTGIGGTTTTIWVKYERLPKASTKKVLVDIRVSNFANWKPTLRQGEEAANGTSNGVRGGLTTKTKRGVWRNGVIVRYMPLKDSRMHIVALFLSVTGANKPKSPRVGKVHGRPVTFTQAGIDIHRGGGGNFYYLMKGSIATVRPLDPVKEVCAITDVMVTDNARRVPEHYTGVSKTEATLPFLPGQVGHRVKGSDVNEGIGGATTTIWVKYERLPKTSTKKVLVDIQVCHWVKWRPTVPAGFQVANGTSSRIKGALTTGTKGSNWRNGLAVRYMPLKDSPTRIMALFLSVTGDNTPKFAPVGKVAGKSVKTARAGIDIHTGGGGNFYYLMKAFAFPGHPIGEIPDQQKVVYLRAYAPQVWLHSKESYWPSSVEWSFQFLKRHYDHGRWWFWTKGKLETPSSILPYFRGAYPKSKAKPALSLRDVPAYAFWHQVNTCEVDLVYFFYYPYNRGKSVMNTIFGSHVGDWEHVTVRLSNQPEPSGAIRLKPWAGTAESFSLAYHSSDAKYAWRDVPKVGGSHPIIYAAEGAHGSYLKPGSHKYGEVKKVVKIADLVDHCNKGTAWDTWKKLECFDYDAKKRLGPKGTWPNWLKKETRDPNVGNEDPASGPVWRWGNFRRGGVAGNYRLEHGPTGPIGKPYFGTPELD